MKKTNPFQYSQKLFIVFIAQIKKAKKRQMSDTQKVKTQERPSQADRVLWEFKYSAHILRRPFLNGEYRFITIHAAPLERLPSV